MNSLGNFACQFLLNGAEINGSAEVLLNSEMDLIVRMPCTKEQSLRAIFDTDLKLKLAGPDWIGCVSTGSEDEGDFIQVIPLRSPLVVTSNEKISKLTFLLGDLPSLKGTHDLISSNWALTINRLDENSSNATVNSMLTHQGTLRRVDGSEFVSVEAERCLIHLCRYFSFCYERWVSVANVEGFDIHGQVVYWQLGAGKLDTADSESNWLDGFQPETALKQLFPGFMSKIEDENWAETLKIAIYWYIRGDTSKVGPDGSLVILQAALERLSWELLVHETRVLSADGFNKLTAADTLRLLLSQTQIPLEIPSGQSTLLAIGKAFAWKDGADAVVLTRNRLVHPPRKKGTAAKFDYYGAYTLAKWYIELVLLRLNYLAALEWPDRTCPLEK
jgi:hypothetical protein